MNVSTFSMCLPREKFETLRHIGITTCLIINYAVLNLSQYLKNGLTADRFRTLRQVWDNFETGNLLCFMGMNQDVLKY